MKHDLGTLDRKSIRKGMLVVASKGCPSTVYKVVDAAACNYLGNREHRGRCCAVREWDVAKDEFGEGPERVGVKPGNLYSYRGWFEYHKAQLPEMRATHDREFRQWKAAKEFMESVGQGDRVFEYWVTGIDGERYMSYWAIRVPDMKALLTELGVIAPTDEKES